MPLRAWRFYVAFLSPPFVGKVFCPRNIRAKFSRPTEITGKKIALSTAFGFELRLRHAAYDQFAFYLLVSRSVLFHVKQFANPGSI